MSLEEHKRYLVENYAIPKIEILRGKGTKLWDTEGNEYLDFTSGIAVTNIGHSHSEWVKAISEQSKVLTHCSNLYSIPEQVRLAKRLVERIGPGKLIFCNSGAEANEGMIKLSRMVADQSEDSERNEIIVAKNAFHGRTMGALSATASSKYRNGFEPLLPGFRFADYNDLNAFESAITHNTRAIMIESIQGEGGIHMASKEFLRRLEKFCNERNLLLLMDEVQAGIGRTGEFLGFQHAGIQPSAIAMAKGLGGGFPIGAIWISEKWAGAFKPGSHGTTFGGSPLACSAAHSVLDVMEKEHLIQKAAELGNYLKGKLVEFIAKYPKLIIEVRGRGLMLGLVMIENPSTAINQMRQKGLLVVGAAGNSIRFLPPLTVEKKEIDHALCVVEEVLGNLQSDFPL